MTTMSDFVPDASQAINELGWGFYFTPETAAVGAAHGLDAFRFYFLGRGGVLGDVESPVVTSAFGYWNPALVERMWTTARERSDLTPREAGRLYLTCSADFGRAHFAAVPHLQSFCDAAQAVLDAADPAGLALFSGYLAEPLVDDLPGRAMQLTTILREFKGSAHLLAVLAVGLSPRIAHGVRRPDFWESFGYASEPVPEATDERRGLLAEADALTLRLIAPAYEVLDADGRVALRDGVTRLAAAVPGA